MQYYTSLQVAVMISAILVNAHRERQLLTGWLYVTPMLQDIHRLRSPERIDCKLAVLIYRWSGTMVSF